MKRKKIKKKSKLFTLPKKLHLLGEDYKIILVPSKKIDAYNKLNHKSMINGQISYNKKRIYIDKTLRKTREMVIWHELGHYFGRYYNLSLSEEFAEAFAKFAISLNKQLGYKK